MSSTTGFVTTVPSTGTSSGTSSGTARDDVRTTTPAPRTPRQARRAERARVVAERAAALPPVPLRHARLTGAAVAVGSLSFAGSFLLVGANPDTSLGVTVGDLMALPFQLSLVALVVHQLRTRAAGLGRGTVGFMRVELGVLALAMAWTVLHGLVPSFRDDLWLAVLDVFWPVSMLGMAVIGIKIAVAGRWRGTARAWPAVAESWAPVCIPVFGATGGAPVADLVAGGHVLVGYVVLGLVLLLAPHLTGARDL